MTADTGAYEPGELVALLDRLADLISTARSMPMSSSVLVNRDDAADLVTKAQAALPDELARASAILADADAVLRQARAEEQQILDAARREAAELVAQEAVVIAAEKRAAEIIAAAQAESAKTARATDDWCDRRLAEVEIDIDALLQQVRLGRNRLAQRLATEPAPDS